MLLSPKLARGLRDTRGVSIGIAILTILVVGFIGVGTLYYMARQEVYADSGSIDFTKRAQILHNVNSQTAPTNSGSASTP